MANDKELKDIETTGVEEAPVESLPKKRGRKPNPNKKTNYFGEYEEDIFRQYCTSTDEAYKNKIFNEVLYPVFTKMVESIIRRYILFTPGEDFQDTFDDAMSHLISKIKRLFHIAVQFVKITHFIRGRKHKVICKNMYLMILYIMIYTLIQEPQMK